MSKFSKGEWRIGDTMCLKGTICAKDEDSPHCIARVVGIEDEKYRAKAEANLRLILNAPKMYERLKLLARLISRQAQGVLQEKIDPAIADSIYELLTKIDDEPVENMKYSSSFFQNRNCEYFPCHEVADEENFSCLFCFCPLYHIENCGGSHRTLSNGVKDCSSCTLPHMNYNAVIGMLREESKKHECSN